MEGEVVWVGDGAKVTDRGAGEEGKTLQCEQQFQRCMTNTSHTQLYLPVSPPRPAQQAENFFLAAIARAQSTNRKHPTDPCQPLLIAPVRGNVGRTARPSLVGFFCVVCVVFGARSIRSSFFPAQLSHTKPCRRQPRTIPSLCWPKRYHPPFPSFDSFHKLPLGGQTDFSVCAPLTVAFRATDRPRIYRVGGEVYAIFAHFCSCVCHEEKEFNTVSSHSRGW